MEEKRANLRFRLRALQETPIDGRPPAIERRTISAPVRPRQLHGTRPRTRANESVAIEGELEATATSLSHSLTHSRASGGQLSRCNGLVLLLKESGKDGKSEEKYLFARSYFLNILFYFWFIYRFIPYICKL